MSRATVRIDGLEIVLGKTVIYWVEPKGQHFEVNKGIPVALDVDGRFVVHLWAGGMAFFVKPGDIYLDPATVLRAVGDHLTNIQCVLK